MNVNHNAGGPPPGSTLAALIVTAYDAAVRVADRMLPASLRRQGYEGADVIHNLLTDPASAGAAAARFDPARGSHSAFIATVVRGGIGRLARDAAKHHRPGRPAPERADAAPGPVERAAAADLAAILTGRDLPARLATAVSQLPEALRREVGRRFPGLAANAGSPPLPPGDEPQDDGTDREGRPNYVRRTRRWKAAQERLSIDLGDVRHLLP